MSARTTHQPDSRHGRPRILHAGSTGMIVGGLVIAIGSLLPWVSTPLGSLSGTAGPGLWTLSAGMLAIAGALIPFRRIALAHAVLPGLAVAVIALWQVARLVQLSATTAGWGTLLPGMGLVMAAGGAVIVLRAATRLRAAS
ncbi:MAG: hypothetical protein GEU83_03695 [Pseudonocardiaceae bacterium]|nr:hypothetical protein [Pseudonocardiaceae bacterium]